MAKYVLVAFDNDKEADNFVEMLGFSWNSPTATVHVKGVWKKPTLFCECPNPDYKSVRGLSHGWRVHKACGKPRRGLWQSPDNKLDPNTPHMHQIVQILTVEGDDKPFYRTATMHD
jgi:hypothetical protein